MGPDLERGSRGWLFSVWVVAGFVAAGALAGLLLGKRFFDSFVSD